jgi:hypothetical protein
MAVSPDGAEFTRVETRSPWVESAYGSVRYVCAVRVESDVFFYYEYTVEDGSHQLRVSRITP